MSLLNCWTLLKEKREKKEKAIQRSQLGGEVGGIPASGSVSSLSDQGFAEKGCGWGRRDMGHLMPLCTLL